MMPNIKIKKLEHFTGVMPTYQTPAASGCDVAAALSSAVVIEAGQRMLVPTGLIFEIPAGYEIQVRPRSGLALKHGVTLVNSPGTIDADYRGELKIIMINLGQEPFVVEPGARIAQLVVAPVVQAQFAWCETVSETARGAGGFGSTGLRGTPAPHP